MDYGCGSGVLAIAARKLGCPTAVGVDVEYEALESAADNAQRNGITDGVEWVHGRSIIPGTDEYDAVVANILVGQLSRPSMVATLALGTKVGGALCLSGIRPDQCAVLERLYAPYYEVEEKIFRDPDSFGKEYWGSWARLILRRKEVDRRELLERISEGVM